MDGLASQGFLEGSWVKRNVVRRHVNQVYHSTLGRSAGFVCHLSNCNNVQPLCCEDVRLDSGYCFLLGSCVSFAIWLQFGHYMILVFESYTFCRSAVQLPWAWKHVAYYKNFRATWKMTCSRDIVLNKYGNVVYGVLTSMGSSITVFFLCIKFCYHTCLNSEVTTRYHRSNLVVTITARPYMLVGVHAPQQQNIDWGQFLSTWGSKLSAIKFQRVFRLSWLHDPNMPACSTQIFCKNVMRAKHELHRHIVRLCLDVTCIECMVHRCLINCLYHVLAGGLEGTCWHYCITKTHK